MGNKVVNLSLVKNLQKEGKKALRGKSKDPHKRILRISLRALIKLLPLAVREFKKSPSGRTAYPITNMIAEIRNLIAHIENTIEPNQISNMVSHSVASSLRRALSKMVSHVISAKKSLPMKIENTANRRNVELMLDGVLKEFEAVMEDTILDIEERVEDSISTILKEAKGVSAKRGRK